MNISNINHRHRTAGAVILRITYGYYVQEKDDPLVQLADDALHQFSVGTAPGSFWVNIIPACKCTLLRFKCRFECLTVIQYALYLSGFLAQDSSA